MDFTSFVRKPFVVEAVEITEDNFEEAAKYIGTICEDPSGGRYIDVDRRLVPNVLKVHVGYWMTRMGKNIRCYSRNVFKSSFAESTPELAEIVKTLDLSGATPNEVFPKEGELQGDGSK